MTSEQNRKTAPVAAPDTADPALEDRHGLKAKVEVCTDELVSANEVIKQKITAGTSTLSARQAVVADSTGAGNDRECADDLHEVTEALVQGIDGLEQAEVALTQSLEVLAQTQAALVTSRAEESEARRLALHDSMTGLPNRYLFDDRLSHAISLAARHNWTLAVMFCDLDGFKTINDTHGHATGDSVLKEVARRLSLHVRDEDTVCRSGGDEFLYLFVDPKGNANIERLAEMVSSNIANPIEVGSLRLVVRASIGIAIYPAGGAAGEELIKNADTAMYRAKQHRIGWVIYNANETAGTRD